MGWGFTVLNKVRAQGAASIAAAGGLQPSAIQPSLDGSALRELLGELLLPELGLVLRLGSHDTTAPGGAGAFVVVGLAGLHNLGKLALILILYGCKD